MTILLWFLLGVYLGGAAVMWWAIAWNMQVRHTAVMWLASLLWPYAMVAWKPGKRK